MNNNEITISQLNTAELVKLFDHSLENRLQSLEDIIKALRVREELLTREEVCDFLKIDLSTLWHWTKKGRLIAYAIATKRYYKKSEVIDALKPLNH